MNESLQSNNLHRVHSNIDLRSQCNECKTSSSFLNRFVHRLDPSMDSKELLEKNKRGGKNVS